MFYVSVSLLAHFNEHTILTVSAIAQIDDGVPMLSVSAGKLNILGATRTGEKFSCIFYHWKIKHFHSLHIYHSPLFVYTHSSGECLASMGSSVLVRSVTNHEHTASTARLFVTPRHGSPNISMDTATLQLSNPTHAHIALHRN